MNYNRSVNVKTLVNMFTNSQRLDTIHIVIRLAKPVSRNDAYLARNYRLKTRDTVRSIMSRD